jgi:hypothetical protein
MDVQLIKMPQKEARAAYEEYRNAAKLKGGAWSKEDVALAQAYKSLAKGLTVIDLLGVMKRSGLREDGFPKFAIARSHAKQVWCSVSSDGRVRFSIESQWDSHKLTSISFPADTMPRFRWDAQRKTDAETLVPIVPPRLRPKFSLEGYFTFWEVESWTLLPPRDPMLLKHLGGWLYAVLAVWDLTDLERAVLGAR